MEMFNLDPDLDFVVFSWILMILGRRTRFEADPPLYIHSILLVLLCFSCFQGRGVCFKFPSYLIGNEHRYNEIL